MKVLNKATDELTENSVYIGRPSKWGNPYIRGVHGTKSEVIQKYEEYLRNSPELLKALSELNGKDLVCWCSPRPCHGNVIIKLINELENESIIER